MATLRLEIVTPEEKIYSEDVDMVTLPGSEGELGVYPKHVPLLTTLMPGELRVLKNGRESSMAIGEGFVEIKADAVSVLTDMALESEKIDIFFFLARQLRSRNQPRRCERVFEKCCCRQKLDIDLCKFIRDCCEDGFGIAFL